jgi:Uma2 family endonuclease
MAVVRQSITEEQFMRLPDDGRKHELVDGEVKEVPTGWKHDAIVALLIALLFPFAKGCGVLTASQAGFRMVGGNLRSPDVSFTVKGRIPGGKLPTGFGDLAPDLCIEVISPSEDMADASKKVDEYFASGARIVWHLFADEQRVVVYTSALLSTTHNADDYLEAADPLPGFRSRVADLFAVD